MNFLGKKPLQVFGVIRRTPFTGGAEVLLGTPDGLERVTRR